ncbi:MAG: PT domain-containing protein [Clostridia bacterium]|nr:PT domain-containing protein [Clostridia bacterium]
MKKLLSIILSAALCIGSIAAVASDTDTTVTLQINNPVMTVNGANKEIDPGMGTVPVIINERTLLPVRAVVEELGGIVNWNGDTREVTLNYGTDEILLTIDSDVAYLNNEAKTLDSKPTIINDRTMLPIRFIAENFGFGVDWNGEEQIVTITKTAKAVAEPTVEPTVEPTDAPTAEPTEVPSDNQAEESKILVAYFSNTGNTENIAESIVSAMGADVYEIEAAQPYTDEDLNYNDSSTRATVEQNDPTARPEIGNLLESIDEYDTIYLGYPMWWGQAPKIVYTFLESYDFTGKTIIPFCTSGSSPIGSSDDNLHPAASGANWVDGRRFSVSASSSEISAWAAEGCRIK